MNGELFGGGVLVSATMGESGKVGRLLLAMVFVVEDGMELEFRLSAMIFALSGPGVVGAGLEKEPGLTNAWLVAGTTGTITAF